MNRVTLRKKLHQMEGSQALAAELEEAPEDADPAELD